MYFNDIYRTNGTLTDFDDDHDVDADDLLVWQTAFGDTTGTVSAADADGDADTDGADFLVWQQNYGTVLTLPGSFVLDPLPSLSPDTTPTFTWQAASGADSYTVTIYCLCDGSKTLAFRRNL